MDILLLILFGVGVIAFQGWMAYKYPDPRDNPKLLEKMVRD